MNDTRKTLFFLTLFIALNACSRMPETVQPHADENQVEEYGIYIASHGWHTGVIVPAQPIQKNIPQLKLRFKNTPFLEFGWGDESFYQAEEITSSLTLRAILWPTKSVVHVVAAPEKPYEYFAGSEVVKICLTKNEFESLLLFLENSFYKNIDNTVLPTKDGIYGDSQFYRGKGDYYLMNTCNKWTARALESSGFDISGTFKLTSESVMEYIEEQNIARIDRSRSCALQSIND